MKPINEIDVLDEAATIADLLLMLLRHLSAGTDDAAADLPLAQLRLCSALVEGPRAMSELGRELGVPLSAIPHLADRLERARLVRRVAVGGDRRVRRLQLTPRGAKLMVLHHETRVRRVLAMLEQLAPRARRDVIAALQMMIQAAAASRQRKTSTNGNGPHFLASKVLL
jgi:MarR family transcriptional regulator, lower aerobic nicotinate degradation pathway regulator